MALGSSEYELVTTGIELAATGTAVRTLITRDVEPSEPTPDEPPVAERAPTAGCPLGLRIVSAACAPGIGSCANRASANCSAGNGRAIVGGENTAAAAAPTAPAYGTTSSTSASSAANRGRRSITVRGANPRRSLAGRAGVRRRCSVAVNCLSPPPLPGRSRLARRRSTELGAQALGRRRAADCGGHGPTRYRNVHPPTADRRATRKPVGPILSGPGPPNLAAAEP
jgi:hypothetical protein